MKWMRIITDKFRAITDPSPLLAHETQAQRDECEIVTKICAMLEKDNADYWSSRPYDTGGLESKDDKIWLRWEGFQHTGGVSVSLHETGHCAPAERQNIEIVQEGNIKRLKDAAKSMRDFLEQAKANQGQERAQNVLQRVDFRQQEPLRVEQADVRSLKALPDRIVPEEGVGALREKILAMPAEEAQVSDALSAMQYGLRVQQAFARATAAFTDHALASVDRLADAGVAFDALVADLTGLAPGGAGDASKPATFSEARQKLDGLGVKLNGALEQVLRRYGDVVQSADLFTACATALGELAAQGEGLCDRAKQNGADYADDLAAAVESVRMTRTVAEFQDLTVRRVLDTERRSVGALRRLAVNTLPLLGTQIAAAATLEGDRLSGSLSGKAGTVERMAVVANPLLVGEGGSDADLADLRARLAEQFSQAREVFVEVRQDLQSVRALAIAQDSKEQLPGLEC